MKFRRAALIGFVLINIGGGIYAARMGEMPHAFVHVLLLAGTYAWWRRRRPGGQPQPDLIITSGLDPELQHLQQSLDAIAVEVERIGESQRFINKLL
jgi:hypothetical protein